MPVVSETVTLAVLPVADPPVAEPPVAAPPVAEPPAPPDPPFAVADEVDDGDDAAPLPVAQAGAINVEAANIPTKKVFTVRSLAFYC